jgi:hypothetical protein
LFEDVIHEEHPIDPWLFEGNDEEEAMSAESDYSMILDELVGSSALQSQASSADFTHDLHRLLSHIETTEELGKCDHIDFMKNLFVPLMRVVDGATADARRINLPAPHDDYDPMLRFWRY